MPEVALWPREQLLYHRCPMKPGMEQKRACCSTALPIPDLIVKEGKKTVINLSVPLLSSLDQGIDHRGIGQGRGIAQLINGALGDLAQDPPHDLSAAGLG